ncbi:MAG: hypothetical protein HQM03_20510 [Magnetococcales bacterium]|nr:hypothetical protein [Magnetococcales bacterium]
MSEALVMRFRLYVVGDSSSGRRALFNFERIRRLLGARAELDVVDILTNPAQAEEDHVVAVPALVRLTPPRIKIIGDLNDIASLKVVLGVDDAALGPVATPRPASGHSRPPVELVERNADGEESLREVFRVGERSGME